MDATEKSPRTELHCPQCGLYLVCSMGDGLNGSDERPPAGWPDAPGHASFYDLFIDPEEIRKATLIEPLWCLDSQTQCPACEHRFTPRDAGIPEPTEDMLCAPPEVPWKKLYKTLETQHMTKSEEFRTRMDLWRRSNEQRRFRETLGQTLLNLIRVFFSMIFSLFSRWHLSWAVPSALIGVAVSFFRGDDGAGMAQSALLFASLPAAILIGGFWLLSPLFLYILLSMHVTARRCKKRWRTDGSIYRKNLSALLPLFDETKPFERLVKAEGHRQLGQFNEALLLIEQGLPEHLNNYSLTLKSLCQNKNDQFIYQESFIEAPDENALLKINAMSETPKAL